MTIQEKFNKITEFLRFLDFQQTFHAKVLGVLAEKSGISMEELAKEFSKELAEDALKASKEIVVPKTEIIT